MKITTFNRTTTIIIKNELYSVIRLSFLVRLALVKQIHIFAKNVCLFTLCINNILFIYNINNQANFC